MALKREQIEHLEHYWEKDNPKKWQKFSYSRRWLKKQMNKFIRLQGKQIDEESFGGKIGRKPSKGWEW